LATGWLTPMGYKGGGDEMKGNISPTPPTGTVLDRAADFGFWTTAAAATGTVVFKAADFGFWTTAAAVTGTVLDRAADFGFWTTAAAATGTVLDRAADFGFWTTAAAVTGTVVDRITDPASEALAIMSSLSKARSTCSLDTPLCFSHWIHTDCSMVNLSSAMALVFLTLETLLWKYFGQRTVVPV
jgi:hypothetical protein